jgi:amino acid adenylation domain-containing protein
LESNLKIIDLERYPDEGQEAEIRKVTIEEARFQFDLSKGPLFRTTLIRVNEDECIALITMHHIISDGWSIALIINEFAKLYEAKIKNEPASLPELTVQYADYAVWQQQWLQGEIYENQLTYWKNKLAGSPPVIDLPTDRPRPAVQSFNGASQNFKISKELSNRLNKMSRQEGVTLFMTMLAAFQSLLHRYCRQYDITVGSPISGRTQSELESLIGFFLNTLVLRSHFEEEPNFKELLRQVREMTLEAYAYQDLPFEKLVEELQPERDMSHAPIFQVMFVFQNIPMETLSLSDLTIEPISLESNVANFDLTLSLFETDTGINGNFDYNTDLFDTSTILRIIRHYQTFLEAITDNPKLKISRIPLLSKEEEYQILDQWNDTRTEYHREWCVHEMFEKQVEHHPDSIALTFEGQQISYAELNGRANQLAHYLRQHGVGPEVLVGLCFDRSFEMIIGILGILKAGGAFLPLDPYYPKERLAYMIEDSGVRILLTQQDLKDKIATDSSDIICLDENWLSISREPQINLYNLNNLDNLAYVIYTSGSTGRPKGTLLRHQGMCNLSAAEIHAFNVGLGSRVLQFSSLSFDAAVWEIFMALLSGATLCLADRETITPAQGLLRILRTEAVNNVTLPPSVLSNMPAESLPNLDTIITAGEKCSRDLVHPWSNCRDFFNAYGPTESTVCASTYLCQEAQMVTPPIGRPIPNFQLYILDSLQQPMPVGVPGELHIGGEGLARGYLGRPELTAENFIPNPFSKEGGERIYKTGDLARYLPDGNIEFLGRIDHQVKVRGFRIELGEIELVLEEHPAIRDVVVLAREDIPGDQRLVAYLIEKDKGFLKIGELRNHLRDHLPDYMIPATFLTLEEFPLTPNGKIDRKALPIPDHSRPELEGEYVAPRNEIEEKIAAICVDLLNIDRVGIYDSFFDLGGHSLLATQFISRLEEMFEVEVPLRNIFDKPTVADLAEFISRNEGQMRDQEMTKIEKLERGEQEFDQILEDLEHLSEEEVQKLLADESQSSYESEDKNE